MKLSSAVRISSLAALALMAFMSAGVAHAAGTLEQRRACRADAKKFCGEYIPNVRRITACMEANKQRLTPACRAQFK